jgi:hypothetical protein
VYKFYNFIKESGLRYYAIGGAREGLSSRKTSVIIFKRKLLY